MLPDRETVICGSQNLQISNLPWRVAPSVDCRRNGTLRELGIRKESLLGVAEWLLDDSKFDGVIRVIDMANGCGYAETNINTGVRAGNGCDTCLVDAPLISSVFVTESIKDALSEPRFLEKIRNKKIRIGSQANLLDLKDAGLIGEMLIDRLATWGRKVDIWVNFRQRYSSRLDQLVDLCRYYGPQEMMSLHISVPLNRELRVNSDFDEYCTSRQIYQTMRGFSRDKFGLINHGDLRDKVTVAGLVVEDVRHLSACPLTYTGRGLDRTDLAKTGVAGAREEHSGNGLVNFSQRELGNAMINSDGVWFRLLLTKMESPTALGFLRLNEDNIGFAFTNLLQHPDFRDDDGLNKWPSGRVRNVDESKKEKERVVALISENKLND